ncbi:family 2 encapsulin nanocompartment cargo protein terpene cyclase [Nocardia brasiliensis]|uniref:family 2 encapsulin nanocompartment cargo protein terpene cyclase n=1 Tax=Nocardia brasiliensis TaxID=37326 RepID=UPI001E45B401|nr:family 2 encapsulin nanocompartment cargo protein terpene cyclase [Nocardia brasiliensis]
MGLVDESAQAGNCRTDRKRFHPYSAREDNVMRRPQSQFAAPSGLGTSAFRIPGAVSPAADENADIACTLTEPPSIPLVQRGIGRTLLRPEHVRHDTCAPLPYIEREWGDGSHSPLYCPATARIDEELGAEVNRRLVAWAEDVGIHEGRMDKFRDTGFGRLAMLTHPDSDDPDLLLVAAQMNAAWWAADDYYADETPLGATPTELPPRLALVMSAMDPPPDAGRFTEQLDEAVAADPVLVALKSATAHLSRHATPSQVMRACNTTFQMYVSWTAYAAWRYLETPPPAWRYLAARQHDSFYTSMTLIDVVGGYELTGNLFYAPPFHRTLMQAGTASVLVNDLYSAEREAADELPDANLVLLIQAEENCSLDDAIERTVALHNDFVRGFEASQRELAAIPSLELHRFLRGAQAWMAGGVEWHSATSRYKHDSTEP